MEISQNLESFRLFAETMKESGKESAVIRATEASVFGSRRLQVSVASDDRAYAFFRSDEAKSANTRTRDIFFKTVAKEFGGEKLIPQSVRDAMTNFGGASDKPLTARRIVAICDAVIEAKAAFARNEVQLPPAAVTEAPTTRLLPEEPGEIKVKAPDMTLATFADVVKSANKPSLVSGFFSFFSFSAPKPKVFTITEGKLAYEDMPDEPDPKPCQQIRKSLVDAIFYDLLTRGKVEMEAISYILDRVKSSLLDKSVMNTPLKVDDPALKDALKMTEEFKYGLQYNDSVSKSVVNRGTLRLNPEVLFDKIVAPSLGKVLGDKNIALFSKAKATVDADGYLSVTLDNARLQKEWSMLSVIDKSVPDLLKGVVAELKNQAVAGFKDLTLKIKPEYDAKTGAINLTMKLPTSSQDSSLLKMVSGLKAIIEQTLSEKMGTNDKQEVCSVPLSEAEKADGSVLMKVAINLRHFGTTQLNNFGMNNSIAGNITDVKFTRNGMIVKIGDNPSGGNVEDAGQIHEDEVADGNDLSLNVVPSAISPTVEQLLRNKVGFTSMSMSTAAGRNGKAGTMKLSIKGLDIPALTASKTGAGFAFLRKIGALQVSDIDIELRPALDPVSKRIRLDVTSLSGTGAVGGVRGSLARKLLSTILPKVLGDLGGVGFVPGDDILSVTVDAQRFLAKVIPDPDALIPGGIPAISEFSADENGFKVGVKC